MPKKFKNIVVVYRPESSLAIKNASELCAWLKKRGLKIYSHPKQKINGQIPRLRASELKKIDLVIVLGGDGTYLQAVRMLDEHVAPILGINMGSLGFLTETRKEDLYYVISLTLDNKMQTRPRSMIKIRIQRKGRILNQWKALNDVVIERGSMSQLINISVLSEDHLVGEVKADGLVIATPTGSTAYNLAAGGPILHPEVQAFVVTPICPHALTHRPIIFPDTQALTFRVLNKKNKAFISVDGQRSGELRPGDEVIIERAKCNHMLLKLPTQNYFDLLREKLKFGERN